MNFRPYFTSCTFSEIGVKSPRSLELIFEKIDDADMKINLRQYYSTPGKDALLFNDDAVVFLRSIPSGSVDIIVTDPAYSGMNNKLKLGKGRIVGAYKDRGKDNGKWFHEFQDTQENYSKFLFECKRILNSQGHIYIMFDSFSLLSLGQLVREYFDVKNLITWDKIDMGMGHYFRRRHEYIIFATNGNNRHISNRSFPDIWRFKRIHGAKYPAQKPVELFQTMISASKNGRRNTVVCDPFVGSGSSAIAALKKGCHFIGCDISIKTLEISRDRISHFKKYHIDPLQNKSSALADDKVFWE